MFLPDIAVRDCGPRFPQRPKALDRRKRSAAAQSRALSKPPSLLFKSRLFCVRGRPFGFARGRLRPPPRVWAKEKGATCGPRLGLKTLSILEYQIRWGQPERVVDFYINDYVLDIGRPLFATVFA